MAAAEKKALAIKFLLVAAIWACPMIGYLWVLAGIIDFLRVRSFQLPIFCILLAEFALEDGVSGTYVSLGYSFELKGNVMPEDELPKVTEYTAKILNTPVMAGVWD